MTTLSLVPDLDDSWDMVCGELSWDIAPVPAARSLISLRAPGIRKHENRPTLAVAPDSRDDLVPGEGERMISLHMEGVLCARYCTP